MGYKIWSDTESLYINNSQDGNCKVQLTGIPLCHTKSSMHTLHITPSMLDIDICAG